MAASHRTRRAPKALEAGSGAETIIATGAVEATALASALGLAENLVSHHLGALRRAGLARDRRDPSDARWVYYTLDAAELDWAHATVSALFDPRTLGARIPTCGPAAACGPDTCGTDGCGAGENEGSASPVMWTWR